MLGLGCFRETYRWFSRRKATYIIQQPLCVNYFQEKSL